MNEGGICLLTGKWRYEQKVDAQAKLAVFKEGHGKERGSVPTRTYYCDLCGGWHLTAKPVWTPARKKRQQRRNVVDWFPSKTIAALGEIQRSMFILNMMRNRKATPARMARARQELESIKQAARLIDLPKQVKGAPKGA